MRKFDLDSERFCFLGHRLFYLKSEAGSSELVWEDVPEHFGRFYPSTVTMSSGIVRGHADGLWYAEQLRRIMSGAPLEYRIRTLLPTTRKQEALFVNCLDPVFGHALYKLASARAVVEENQDCDVFLIVTQNLLPYASFASGLVIVEEPLSRLLRPSSNLLSVVLACAQPYPRARWAFCNGSRLGLQQELPQPHDLPEVGEDPLLTFVHRDDRTWGWPLALQIARVNRVFYALKRLHPNLKTVVVGMSRKSPKYRADLNLITTQPSDDAERRLIAIALRSACVFGVHGSHLLVPAYNAQATVELLPSNRLGNAVQAYWPNPSRSVIETLFTYRVLMGDRFLFGVGTSCVIQVIHALISGLPGLQARLNSDVGFADVFSAALAEAK